MSEIVVNERDVRPGDVIVDVQYKQTWTWGSGCTYLRVTKIENGVIFVDNGRGGDSSWHRIGATYGVEFFKVVRDSRTQEPKPMSSKLDDGYNGNCPRCGRRTYTSALFIEHQGGSCS